MYVIEWSKSRLSNEGLTTKLTGQYHNRPIICQEVYAIILSTCHCIQAY